MGGGKRTFFSWVVGLLGCHWVQGGGGRPDPAEEQGSLLGRATPLEYSQILVG